MVGIISYGAYIPCYRLARKRIADEWGAGGGRGEKAVANFDEDSLTMAVEASLNALGGMEPDRTQAIFFASTTSPYGEKLAASLLSMVLDQPRDARTADFAGSLRAGTTAVASAIDAIKAGAAKRVLVAAGECRLGEPESEQEMSFGDGAGALLLGEGDVIAEVEAHVHLTDEFTGTWRRREDPYVQSFPGGFDQTLGYRLVLPEAIRGLLRSSDRKPIDYTRLILPGSNARSMAAVAKSLEFDPATQLADPLLERVGDTGSAQPFLLLAAALETAKPGDRILWASYGDGADVFSLRITEAIGERKKPRGVSLYLASRRELASYGKYARFRQLLRRERREGDSSPIVLWRERHQDLQLYGEKCSHCALVQFPRHRVCVGCGSKDSFEDVKLPRRGTVHTFTADSLVPSLDPPTTHTVVDIEGGGRVFLFMTDCDSESVKIGMPVEFTFRKLHEGGGFPNYFWKARPLRNS